MQTFVDDGNYATTVRSKMLQPRKLYDPAMQVHKEGDVVAKKINERDHCSSSAVIKAKESILELKKMQYSHKNLGETHSNNFAKNWWILHWQKCPLSQQ